MATVNREIYSFSAAVAALLAELQNGQRGIISDEPGLYYHHNQVYKEQDNFYMPAISRWYDGVVWNLADAEFGILKSDTLMDATSVNGLTISAPGALSLDGFFSTNSIIACLNELTGIAVDGEWTRTVDVGVKEILTPKQDVLPTWVHVAKGLTDDIATAVVPLTQTGNTALDVAFGTNISLIAALNYLSSISGGTPGGVDTNVQYNNGGVFGGSAEFTYVPGIISHGSGALRQSFEITTGPQPISSFAMWDSGDSNKRIHIAMDEESVNSTFEMKLYGSQNFDISFNDPSYWVTVNDVRLRDDLTIYDYLAGNGAYVNLQSAYFPERLYWKVSEGVYEDRIHANVEDYIDVHRAFDWVDYTDDVSVAGNLFNALLLNNWVTGLLDDGGTDLTYYTMYDGLAPTDADMHFGSYIDANDPAEFINSINLSANLVYIERDDKKINLFDLYDSKYMEFDLKFSTGTGSNPSLGYLQYDNGTQHSATKVYMSYESSASIGENRKNQMNSIIVGSYVYVYKKNNNIIFDKWKITGITTSATVVTYDIEMNTNEGAAFGANEDLVIVFVEAQEIDTTPTLSFPYKFSTATGTPPASGTLRYNNVTQHSATNLYVHYVTQEGDRENILNSLVVGDRFYVFNTADSSVFDEWEITVVTPDVTYVNYSVTLVASSGVDFTNNQNITMVLGGGGGGGGGLAYNINFKASNVGNQALPNVTTTKVTFSVEDYDDNGSFDLPSDVFVVPVGGGKIHLTLSVLFSIGAGGQCEAYLYKNGAIYRTQSAYFNQAGTTGCCIPLVEEANAGDYYELYAYQSSGFAATILGSQTFFTGVGIN